MQKTWGSYLNGFSLVASPVGKLILFMVTHNQFCYKMPITVTSPRDHLTPKVIPTEGLHDKKVVAIEEGERKAPDMIYKS